MLFNACVLFAGAPDAYEMTNNLDLMISNPLRKFRQLGTNIFFQVAYHKIAVGLEIKINMNPRNINDYNNLTSRSLLLNGIFFLQGLM